MQPKFSLILFSPYCLRITQWRNCDDREANIDRVTLTALSLSSMTNIHGYLYHVHVVFGSLQYFLYSWQPRLFLSFTFPQIEEKSRFICKGGHLQEIFLSKLSLRSDKWPTQDQRWIDKSLGYPTGLISPRRSANTDPYSQNLMKAYLSTMAPGTWYIVGLYYFLTEKNDTFA